MAPVLKVEGLSKKYLIRHQKRPHYGTLRDALAEAARGMTRRAAHPFRSSSAQPGGRFPSTEEFWALRDVSFEMSEGERLGIIGRNGAGKTTLLKILSRITEPTEGRVRLKGRVASLLEVGTGFHPELTGRENIFLNGAILGMGRQEIHSKFDEIVAFAEVEKFLDTPVKRYSSGMYVRLAFAVAAHLEPEILVVDEVLAVGDAQFQKKCLGKMEDVSSQGRTVLFVSHNMPAVQRLCGRSLLLEGGRTVSDGPSREVIDRYLEGARGGSSSKGGTVVRQPGAASPAQLLELSLADRDGLSRASFRMDEGMTVRATFEVAERLSDFHIYARVYTSEDLLAFATADWDGGEVEPVAYSPGRYCASVDIPPHLLNAGRYTLGLDGLVPGSRYLFSEDHLISWEVTPHGGAGGTQSLQRQGVVRPRLRWTVSPA